jgi:cytochrome c biogenesis protein CcmG, thiol:disulfide interchange protein DsbE
MRSVKIDLLLRIALAALVAAFIYVIYDGIREHITEEGDTAPSFTITADDGRTISVPNFGGKVLVLNFWASWCPPCIEETPSLSELAAQFTNRGVVVLAVSIDKDEKAYRDFLKRYNPAFLTARDPEIKISADYGTFKIPETYIIDSRGKVLHKVISNDLFGDGKTSDWTDPRMTSYIGSLL